jgi:hypothetical protein
MNLAANPLPCRHLSRVEYSANDGLLSVTQPYRIRCDEIALQLLRDPLALLPVARSPSRYHCWNRWWALTPPFQPLPSASSCLQQVVATRREYSLLRL